jgi:AraC-like DNA-binding protein
MDWSFSEFLNLMELRSQTWCTVDLGRTGGFRQPSSEAVLFYAVLQGSCRLSWRVGEWVEFNAGDIALLTSGEPHVVRCERAGTTEILKFLADGTQVDAPHSFRLGDGPAQCQILCGRLKTRWPGATRPVGMPALLRSSASEAGIDLAAVVRNADGSGGTSLLTRMAMMLFIHAFRAHPAGKEVFRNSGLRAPITQAIQFIETHPFIDWSVARLASKVGMGRSNFAMRFTADVGRTPMTYVTEQRMKHAAAFLERTDLKVAEIAERIGYRSESAFSHRFLAHFGVTPGQLRNRRRASRPAS